MVLVVLVMGLLRGPEFRREEDDGGDVDPAPLPGLWRLAATDSTLIGTGATAAAGLTLS